MILLIQLYNCIKDQLPYKIWNGVSHSHQTIENQSFHISKQILLAIINRPSKCNALNQNRNLNKTGDRVQLPIVFVQCRRCNEKSKWYAHMISFGVATGKNKPKRAKMHSVSQMLWNVVRCVRLGYFELYIEHETHTRKSQGDQRKFTWYILMCLRASLFVYANQMWFICVNSKERNCHLTMFPFHFISFVWSLC